MTGSHLYLNQRRNDRQSLVFPNTEDGDDREWPVSPQLDRDDEGGLPEDRGGLFSILHHVVCLNWLILNTIDRMPSNILKISSFEI